MLLLDTNVVSELMRETPNTDVLHWLDRQNDANVFVSAVTHCEIELGLAQMPEGKKKRLLIEHAAQILNEEFADRCLSLNAQCGAIYAQLMAANKAKGRPTSVEDGMIAAIALAHQLRLVTRNTKDFEGVAGLTLVNPWLP